MAYGYKECLKWYYLFFAAYVVAYLLCVHCMIPEYLYGIGIPIHLYVLCLKHSVLHYLAGAHLCITHEQMHFGARVGGGRGGGAGGGAGARGGRRRGGKGETGTY